MGNYELLKAAINEVIKANGRQEITGEVLNQVLLSMVNSLGAGYQCMGVATPSTNPGTPDQNVFYFATQAGTYTNFDAIVLQAGISVLMWDGDWASQTWFTVDDEPTANSENLVKSGGVNKVLNKNLNENNLLISKIINITNVGDIDATECKADIELSAGEYEISINPISAVFSSEVRLHLLYEGHTIPAAYLNTTNPVDGKIRVKSNRNIISVGYSGTISSAGSVEIYVKSLKKTDREIEVSQKSLFYLPHILVNGTINVSGGLDLYKPLSRISSVNSYVADEAIEVNVKSGYRYVLHYYNQDGSFKNSEGWFTSSKIIEAGSRWGITIGTIADSIYESPDIIENSISLNSVNNSTETQISVNGQGGTGILSDFQIGEKRLYKFSIPEKWSITNVGSVGNNVITVGYKIGNNRVDIFQRTKQRLESEGWPTEFFVEFPSFDIDGFYVFLRADTGAVANVYYGYYNYDKLNVPTTYQGQRIEIEPKYAMSVLSRMNDYGTPSVAINAQGMNVYNNRYIIQGSNKVGVGSHFVIIDLQEKTLNTITYETLQSGQGFHMNNINLAGKYQDTDVLPLAYCSECFNEKSCKVVRFSDTLDSSTIIQTIKYSGTTIQIQNYMDWILDYENGMIYAFKDSNNGLDLYGFNLPSLENSDVVLGDADIIKTIRIPNTSGKAMVTQGGAIINGRLWTVFGMDTVNYPGFMAISDLSLQQMVSFVNLSGLGECESVCPYKQGVLICCASGGLNASSLANPAYVYMIFNV